MNERRRFEYGICPEIGLGLPRDIVNHIIESEEPMTRPQIVSHFSEQGLQPERVFAAMVRMESSSLLDVDPASRQVRLPHNWLMN